MDSVGIVACSNALPSTQRTENQLLFDFLESSGHQPIISNCIYEKENAFSGTGKERADALMTMFANPEIRDIYDISGGDMANEILDFLDFEKVKCSSATFWGYSDLTTVINAIYTQTGKASVLYQIKNVIHPDVKAIQQARYLNRNELFSPAITMIQGDDLNGIVVGGNIRCFLKLAGTKYFPDLTDKVLLLEARSGMIPQMVTYLSQLRSCGAFDKINGVLLGTFSEMEQQSCVPDIVSLVRSFVGSDMSIGVTPDIGHGHNAKAIWIGKHVCNK